MDVHHETAQVHFPIEGQSPWVNIFRSFLVSMIVLAVASIVTLGLFGKEGSAGTMPWIWNMIGALLIFEYFIFLKVIVPRTADYGRFRVYENRVDFYPLALLGMGVGRAPESVGLQKFKGVAVQEASAPQDNRTIAGYGIFLMGPVRGRTIRLRICSTRLEAEQQAHHLAQIFHLPVVPYKETVKSYRRAL